MESHCNRYFNIQLEVNIKNLECSKFKDARKILWRKKAVGGILTVARASVPCQVKLPNYSIKKAFHTCDFLCFTLVNGTRVFGLFVQIQA